MCVCVCTCVCSYPSAVVAHGAASSQAGVEVCDAVGATDGSVLMDPAATVDVTASCQVPVSHRQSWTADTDETFESNKQRQHITVRYAHLVLAAMLKH